MNRRTILRLYHMTTMLGRLRSATAQQKAPKSSLSNLMPPRMRPPLERHQAQIANPSGILMLDAGGRYALFRARADPGINRGAPTTEEIAATVMSPAISALRSVNDGQDIHQAL
jgi:hypothetical protein